MNEYKTYLSDIHATNETKPVSDLLIKQIAVLKSDLSLSQLTCKHALANNAKLEIEKALLLTLLRR